MNYLVTMRSRRVHILRRLIYCFSKEDLNLMQKKFDMHFKKDETLDIKTIRFGTLNWNWLKIQMLWENLPLNTHILTLNKELKCDLRKFNIQKLPMHFLITIEIFLDKVVERERLIMFINTKLNYRWKMTLRLICKDSLLNLALWSDEDLDNLKAIMTNIIEKIPYGEQKLVKKKFRYITKLKFRKAFRPAGFYTLHEWRMIRNINQKLGVVTKDSYYRDDKDEEL